MSTAFYGEVRMEYIPVIGLEVHVQMNTRTKLFCGCSTTFGASPNLNTCPVCLGMPGALPVPNQSAIDMAIKASLALNCNVEQKNIFARKNYFYPDLPKGYQISQYEYPLAKRGHVSISVGGSEKRINITRLHVEEDAGKLVHGGSSGEAGGSSVDLNRAGVPLMEIVSEPELCSALEAGAYLRKIREIIAYLGVSDCNMEEGSLRCDANISVMPVGSSEFGTRAEIKNMNSFRFLERAVTFEIERQIDVIEDGGRVIQETRLFNPDKGITVSMRTKEEANDYRYFPDPDLLPIYVDDEWRESVRKTLPELPDEKRARFTSEYKLPTHDAGILTSDCNLADYFEKTLVLFNEPKQVSNWIMGEIIRSLNDSGLKIEDFPVSPERLSGLLELVRKGVVSGKIAKKVFDEMVSSGKSPEDIVKEQGLVQLSDESEITGLIDSVIAEHPLEAEEYRGGKERVFGFFVGQVMKASRGKANPGVVNGLLKKRLSVPKPE